MHSIKSGINQASLGFSLITRRTRKAVFLDEMDRVVLLPRLVDLIAPHYPEGRIGRPFFLLEAMLRTHFQQQWFNLSDSAMEEAFFDIPLYREFVGFTDDERLPGERTIQSFRHLFEEHRQAINSLAEVNAVLLGRGLMPKEGSAVDTTLIAAPSSTKYNCKARDPEMHSSQKERQWHFGMNTHTCVDVNSGLVHAVRCTSGHAQDITQPHGQEKVVWVDAGYHGVQERAPEVTLHVAMRLGKRNAPKHSRQMGELLDKPEKLKAAIRAKVEYPFRAIKRQLGCMKTRCLGLKKNTARI